MNFLHKTVFKLLLIILVPFSNLVYASTQTGMTWLSAQVSNDNNYSTNTKIATPFQSLCEMQTAFNVNGQPIPLELVNQINSEDYNGTSYLSQKVVANLQTSGDTSILVNKLLKHQNLLNSFGEESGYHGSILDTALALNALSQVGVSGQNVNNALGFLLDNQQVDGSWKDGQNESSVYLRFE